MSSIIIKYGLDLTGRNPSNLVTGEPHDIAATGAKRVLVPRHGPFFTRSLVVRVRSSGALLTPGTQYKAVQLFPDATQRTGQNICSVVLIEDETAPTDLEIQYQALGGEYSSAVTAIEQMVASLELDNRPVRWGQLLGKPEYFAPSPHYHDLGDVYGFEYIVTALEGIRQAILMGDVFRFQEIYDYVDAADAALSGRISSISTDITAHINNFGNPHRVDKSQVGLSNVQNYPVATTAQAQGGTHNASYMTPATSKAQLNTHAQKYDNPHNVTKSQVGLGNVQDFPVCTLEEALAGVSTTAYTTPYHVQAMIDQAILENTPPPPPDTSPTARFVYGGATTVDAGANHVLTFADQSINGTRPIVSWFWEFGDGTTSAVQNPAPVTYTRQDASYQITVRLTVADANGLSHTQSQVITLNHNAPVLTPPTANFTFSGSQNVVDPANPVIDFTDTSTAGSGVINTWFWEFGDGTTSSAQHPQDKTYNMAVGTTSYTVKLTVTDVNGLSASKTATLTLSKSLPNTPPSAQVTWNSAQQTVTDPAVHSITFTNASTQGTTAITKSEWTYGDGSPVETKFDTTSVTHVYNVPVGTTNVTLTLKVTDAAGLTNSKSYTIALVKNAAPQNPPTSSFTTSGATTVVEGTNHVISVTDGSTPGSATITNWHWDWGDGTSSTGKTPSPHTYALPVGTYNRTITLTVTDTNGKTGTFSRTLSLTKTAASPPAAAFTTSGATTVQEGNNHTISVTNQSVAGTDPIASYLWSWGDGTTSTEANPAPKVYNTPVGTTTYTISLKATDTVGRTNTTTRTVTLTKTAFVLPEPTNLGFELGDTGWAKSGTAAIVTGTAHAGSWLARLSYNGANSSAVFANGGRATSPGAYVKVACYVKAYGASDQVGGHIRLMWLDRLGNVIGSVAGNDIQVAYYNGVWTLSAVGATAPANTAYYTVQGEGYILPTNGKVEFDSFDLAYTGTLPGSGGGGGGGGGGDPGDPPIQAQ